MGASPCSMIVNSFPLWMQGNVVYDTEYCIMDNKFRDLVTEHKVS